MLKTYLTNDDIIEFEPALDDYLRATQTDFQDQIDKTFEILVQDLKANGLEIRNLCTPLNLQSSVTKTTSFTGTGVDDDIERRMWVVEVTANTGNVIITLEGSNDNVTYAEAEEISISDTGLYTKLMTNLYSYYRVTVAGTSVTYSSLIVEESFYLCHLYLALWKIYISLKANVGDTWESQAEYYWNLYQQTIKTVKYSYDASEDGSINEGEEQKTYRAQFRR